MVDLAGALAARLQPLTRSVLAPTRVGVDVVHIPTWQRHLELGGAALLLRVYTDAEIEFCAGRLERLSSRLAGKEAVLKALGTGIRGIGLSDVEVLSEPTGRPTVVLRGLAMQRTAELALQRIELSLCHEQEFAFAVAAGIGEVTR